MTPDTWVDQGDGYESNSETQLLAFEQSRDAAETDRAKALEIFRNRGSLGAASPEIAELLHKPCAWVMPRITELKKQGKIKPDPSGRRFYNAESKMEVTVWVITEEGM